MAIYDVNGIADHLAAVEEERFELNLRALGISKNDVKKVSANVAEGARTTIYSTKAWRRIYLDLSFYVDPVLSPMDALDAHKKLIGTVTAKEMRETIARVRDSAPQAH